MTGITGVDGLASGIQTTEIVDAMIAAARNSTRVQENRKEVLEARLEAVRSFNTRLLSAQLDLSTLRSGAAFRSMGATSSQPSVFTATAGTAAVPGAYNFEVTQLAQAHQIATAGQSSRTTDLGAGSISLQLGNGAAVDIALSAEASSLDDIAQAISNAGAGVTAYVVQQDGENPYRLVVQSRQTGMSSEISISANGALEGLFAESSLEVLSDAQDAQIKMGSGAGALSFSSATNQFTNVIPGVTIQAASVGSGTLNVSRDVEGASEAIGTFVESLNGAIDYLRANTTVDPNGGDSGILLSETDLRRGLDSVIRQLFSAVPGLPQDMNNVTAIGLGLDRNSGQVTIDKDRLSAALASNPEGVARLFNNTGTSSVPGIEFAALASQTRADAPFSVSITKAATQATTLGATIASDATVEVTANNRSFSLEVNGRAYTMSLAEGSYDRNGFINHLQSVLNEQLPTQDKLNVGLNGDRLMLSTQRYGSGVRLNVLASSANDLLQFQTGLRRGENVQGTINGQAATGAGQILTGTEGDADGLTLVVNATSPISNAIMNVSVGLGTRLGDRFTALTDNQTGSVVQKTKSLSSSIGTIQEQIRNVDARLELRREGLLRQFRTMETLIGQFQSQQNFLAGAVDGWNNLSRSISRGK